MPALPCWRHGYSWLIDIALVTSSAKKKASEHLRFEAFAITGAGERNRTLDLLITSELLYQLSYAGNLILAGDLNKLGQRAEL
jgi:hypothetical protein